MKYEVVRCHIYIFIHVHAIYPEVYVLFYDDDSCEKVANNLRYFKKSENENKKNIYGFARICF